jgi:molybdate transport system ATP-binding protein
LLEVKIKRKLPGFSLDIDFSVDQEIMAILGPSGSGKTMTLHCIAGLMQPDEGTIKLNTKVLFDSTSKTNLSPQMRRVGFVFQNFALFPHLTITENIAYGMRHWPKDKANKRVTELLETMNIPELGQRYPKQLSGGQQQRVALARAIAPEPEILLLDEPFSALDTQVKERLELELLSLHNYYQGNVLFVTHNLSEGYRLASKIAVYESGHIIQCDCKTRIINSPINHTVARLTGFRNLFRGSLQKIEDGSAWVMVDELHTVLRIELKPPFVPIANQRVIIGIRPEYVHLSDYPVENTIECTVNKMVDGISSVDGFFHIEQDTQNKHRLEAKLSRSDAELIQTGQKCYVHLHPDHLTIMPGA